MVKLIHKCNLLKTEWDDINGEYVNSLSKDISCRIIYKVNKVIDDKGEEVVSNIKIILPNIDINPNDQIRLDKDYAIKSLAPKQDLKGKVEYMVIYV